MNAQTLGICPLMPISDKIRIGYDLIVGSKDTAQINPFHE